MLSLHSAVISSHLQLQCMTVYDILLSCFRFFFHLSMYQTSVYVMCFFALWWAFLLLKFSLCFLDAVSSVTGQALSL